MITCITLRDSTGRIKTFAKNQIFSEYEKHKWSLGMGADGNMITYLPITQDAHITVHLEGRIAFMIYVFAGDFFTLEDVDAPAVNPLTPLSS